MGFQPVPNVMSVELVYWNGSTYSENVLHYKPIEPMGEADQNDFALQIRSWWSDEMKSNVPTTIFLAKILMRDLTVQNGVGIEFTGGLPLPGTNNDEPLPMSCTVAVKWSTGLRGRSYRGRSYHVGLTEFQVTGDKLKPETGTNLLAAWSSLLDVKYQAEDPGWCVVSRWANMLPRPSGVATIITGVSIDEVVDSQRRRLLGRGM